MKLTSSTSVCLVTLAVLLTAVSAVTDFRIRRAPCRVDLRAAGTYDAQSSFSRVEGTTDTLEASFTQTFPSGPGFKDATLGAYGVYVRSFQGGTLRDQWNGTSLVEVELDGSGDFESIPVPEPDPFFIVAYTSPEDKALSAIRVTVTITEHVPGSLDDAEMEITLDFDAELSSDAYFCTTEDQFFWIFAPISWALAAAMAVGVKKSGVFFPSEPLSVVATTVRFVGGTGLALVFATLMWFVAAFLNDTPWPLAALNPSGWFGRTFPFGLFVYLVWFNRNWTPQVSNSEDKVFPLSRFAWSVAMWLCVDNQGFLLYIWIPSVLVVYAMLLSFLLVPALVLDWFSCMPRTAALLGRGDKESKKEEGGSAALAENAEA